MGYDPEKLTSYFDDTTHLTKSFFDLVLPAFENLTHRIQDQFDHFQ